MHLLETMSGPRHSFPQGRFLFRGLFNLYEGTSFSIPWITIEKSVGPGGRFLFLGFPDVEVAAFRQGLSRLWGALLFKLPPKRRNGSSKSASCVKLRLLKAVLGNYPVRCCPPD